MSVLLLAIVSIAMSVAAQFALRAGMAGFRAAGADAPWFELLKQPHLYLGFALYGASAIVWLGVLARWEVSKAYPLVGMGLAASLIVGFFVGEHVTALRWLGVLLICAGVALVARS